MNSDTIIIGGGVIGMLTARELALAGQRVTLFDRQDTGRESSWAGGGIVSPLYPWRYAEPVSALAGWSQRHYRALYEQLHAATGIDPEWTPNGLLIIAPDEQRDATGWARHHAAEVQCLDRLQLARLEPALARPQDGAIWMPEVAQVRNPRLVKALRRDLELRGVPIHEHEAVTAIATHHGRVQGIHTARGNYPARTVVICAGAWSAALLDGLTPAPPITPVLGQMILFKAPPGTIRCITLESDRYIIPRRDGRVLFGSTLEQCGFEKRTSDTAGRQLRESAIQRFPRLADCPVEHHWAGLRPASPSGIPYIGPVPDLEGLYLNAGHFRNGVVLGPASCRLLTDLLLTREPVLDPAPYRLDAPRQDPGAE
ncbi:MAG: glycine oxidase ThiO [gamma proteobacterium symbiont of Phacoides pectinatus]